MNQTVPNVVKGSGPSRSRSAMRCFDSKCAMPSKPCAKSARDTAPPCRPVAPQTNTRWSAVIGSSFLPPGTMFTPYTLTTEVDGVNMSR